MFTDTLQQYIHVSRDYVNSVQSHSVPFRPTEVSHHPYDPNVLLVHDTQDPQNKVMYMYCVYKYSTVCEVGYASGSNIISLLTDQYCGIVCM